MGIVTHGYIHKSHQSRWTGIKFMRNTVRAFVKYSLSAIAVVVTQKAAATGQAWIATPKSQITMVDNLWQQDQMQVQLASAPLDNGCGSPGNYVTSASDPANHMIQSMLLTAYISGKPVVLILEGCSGSSNVIIQIQM